MMTKDHHHHHHPHRLVVVFDSSTVEENGVCTFSLLRTSKSKVHFFITCVVSSIMLKGRPRSIRFFPDFSQIFPDFSPISTQYFRDFDYRNIEKWGLYNCGWLSG